MKDGDIENNVYFVHRIYNVVDLSVYLSFKDQKRHV